MNDSTLDRRPPLGLFPARPSMEALRTRRDSRRSGHTCVHWARRFILFCTPRHPRELSEGDFNRLLTGRQDAGNESPPSGGAVRRQALPA